jgi:hypothetical protein
MKAPEARDVPQYYSLKNMEIGGHKEFRRLLSQHTAAKKLVYWAPGGGTQKMGDWWKERISGTFSCLHHNYQLNPLAPLFALEYRLSFAFAELE